MSLSALRSHFRNFWFHDAPGPDVFLNDTAARIRAGLLLAIPIFMAFTLFEAIYGSHWVVTGAMIKDTFETDFDGRILYHVEAVRRTLEYSFQTKVLLYALFEMIAGMVPALTRLSPTAHLAILLAKGKPPVWKPLAAKRWAWGLGAIFISVCLIFFNPEVFAGWVNTLSGSTLLPTDSNYMPKWIPLTLVWVCFGFMWLETVLGFCFGCQLHALLARAGLLHEPCLACQDLSFAPPARDGSSH